VQTRTPNPPRYEKIIQSSTEGGNYNVAAVRAALRVFLGVYGGLKGWEAVMKRIAARRAANAPTPAAKAAAAATAAVSGVVHSNPNARLALAFSSLLLFHRLLHRFFQRLRASLLEPSAEPFRKRNPAVTQALTSRFTPAVGAALAGACLGASPTDQLRMTLVVYVFSRSLEFGYDALVEGKYLWAGEEGRPWWFGSWMMMPFVCGQLLHAFVFDRDCFPESYGKFILARSPEYVQLRPADYPPSAPWPSTFDVVDALAELSKLRWPKYKSPILFPDARSTLPDNPIVAKIAAIASSAHPATFNTSCAVLHPNDPSCARTYLKYWIAAFPAIAKFFTLIYGAFALLAYKQLLKDPMPVLNKVSQRILRISLFITGAIGTSWGSICMFGNVLPQSMLAKERWFLGGFLGGMWAFVARKNERSNFLYSARLSIDSLYKVGKKRGWWRGVHNGDVLLFIASLAVLNVVHEAHPTAIKSGPIRKLLSMLDGAGWVDRVAVAKAKEQKPEIEGVEKKDR